ncbi:MAG: hypothetical protein ACTSR8_02190 [Promethearchaeota archaeon]
MIVDKDIWNYFKNDFEEYLEELELRKRQVYLEKIKTRFIKLPCPICKKKNLALEHYCLHCGTDLKYSLKNVFHH